MKEYLNPVVLPFLSHSTSPLVQHYCHLLMYYVLSFLFLSCRIGEASRSDKRSSSRTYSKANSRSRSSNYGEKSKVSSMFDNEKAANDDQDSSTGHALNSVSSNHRTRNQKHNTSTKNRNDTATGKLSHANLHSHRTLVEKTSVKRDESHHHNKPSSSQVRRHNGSPVIVASSKSRQLSNAPTPTANFLRSEDDVSILSPPSEVPLPSKDVSFRSETVWFTERPEETVVSAGRALRLVCSVNARGPVGEFLMSCIFEGFLFVK